jgi:hypothetical protein
MSQFQLDTQDRIRHHADKLHDLVKELRLHDLTFDQRWISLGATQLQLGIMCLTRGVLGNQDRF